MRYLLELCLFVLLISCSSSKKVPSNENNGIKIQYPEAILSDNITITDIKEHVTLISSKIEGHILFLQIEYSGICDVNEVQLLGDKKISKSLPPIRTISLNIGKECATKKKEKTTLAFAIRNLAYGGTNSEIILHFPQFGIDLSYKNE